MRPTKFLDDDHKQQLKSGIVINGPRPTPLKLKQESHTIQKHHHKQQQIRKPIIIYVHSPEVIHTKPHDFMALVQRLTGNDSRSKDQQQQKKKTLKQEGFDLNDNEFSNDSGVTHERDKGMKSKSPLFNTPADPSVADIPLFTPNTSDYFFSPQRFLKLSDMVSSSPNVNTSSSPGSLVDLMKELREY
ncbi:hypothetical protein L1987_11149 [Smallanthus sonchifolius]|uniref:Uncharacterized protein n=2 Tax=Smallanthus sonchifolius TaxID=185202 RepID=A0ACB9JA37_9ASTR|nr:hypothetical protein L1987_11148 [Smallanthus sonchifolius]KAI3817359.1 hypothetical protein L1987_11149 [Smallanthus sonchifolius]